MELLTEADEPAQEERRGLMTNLRSFDLRDPQLLVPPVVDLRQSAHRPDAFSRQGANRLMARKWAATPAMTSRWKTSW